MKLSKELAVIFSGKDGKATVGSILDHIDTKSYGVLLTILSLPSALPIPAPGYSVPFAIAIGFVAKDLARGMDSPNLPKSVTKREIKLKEGSFVFKAMQKFLSFFEYFVRPRFSFLFNKKWFRKVLGWMVVFCAASMTIPIPLTNTIPAFGIFLMAMGMIEEDFLFALAGILVALSGVIFAITVVVLFFTVGPEITDIIKDFIIGIFSQPTL